MIKTFILSLTILLFINNNHLYCYANDADAEKGETVSKEFIHQGIAARSFERVFALAEHVKVKDATYSDGILAIKLIREIPEAEKPIEIKVK